MSAAHTPSSTASRPAQLLVAGFGCRRDCSVEEFRRLLEDGLRERGVDVGDLHALASIEIKLGEPGLQALALQLGLPLLGFTAEQLQGYEPRLTSLSEASRRATGCAGVAEASALALAEALGESSAELLIAKQRSANATFALACASSLPASEHP